MGQVQKGHQDRKPQVSSNWAKLGKQGPQPSGNLSSPSLSRFRPLTFHVAGHVVWTLPWQAPLEGEERPKSGFVQLPCGPLQDHSIKH